MQQIVEEFIEVKGFFQSVSNENVNFKVEKKLWKDIQDCQSKDNESLIEEKNRFNNFVVIQ